MNLRTPWIAVLLALASGLFLWFGIMDGMPGIRMVGYSLAFAVAVVGPVLAAVRLGKEAAASPVFRRRLLVLLAVPTVASLAFA